MAPKERDPSGTLTFNERHLLELKGCTEHEITAIDLDVSGCALGEYYGVVATLSRLVPSNDTRPQLNVLWKDYIDVTESRAPGQDEPSDGELSDALAESIHLQDLDAVWRREGIAGVIKADLSRFVSLEDTYYTFIYWKQIRHRFVDLELTPFPDQRMIEEACGAAGLRLPAIFIDDTTFYDFEFVHASDEIKQHHAQALADSREAVLRYIIGRRLEPWQ